MENTIFGLTESQLAGLGMTIGVGGLMAYMLFIIGQLAWESKAGKFGTFILFLALGLSMVGFISKFFIEKVVEDKVEARQAIEQQKSEPPPPK